MPEEETVAEVNVVSDDGESTDPSPLSLQVLVLAWLVLSKMASILRQ